MNKVGKGRRGGMKQLGGLNRLWKVCEGKQGKMGEQEKYYERLKFMGRVAVLLLLSRSISSVPCDDAIAAVQPPLPHSCWPHLL
jgi:hypothetical protein